jgi:hypothetical protein
MFADRGIAKENPGGRQQEAWRGSCDAQELAETQAYLRILTAIIQSAFHGEGKREARKNRRAAICWSSSPESFLGVSRPATHLAQARLLNPRHLPQVPPKFLPGVCDTAPHRTARHIPRDSTSHADHHHHWIGSRDRPMPKYFLLLLHVCRSEVCVQTANLPLLLRCPFLSVASAACPQTRPWKVCGRSPSSLLLLNDPNAFHLVRSAQCDPMFSCACFPFPRICILVAGPQSPQMMRRLVLAAVDLPKKHSVVQALPKEEGPFPPDGIVWVRRDTASRVGSQKAERADEPLFENALESCSSGFRIQEKLVRSLVPEANQAMLMLLLKARPCGTSGSQSPFPTQS